MGSKGKKNGCLPGGEGGCLVQEEWLQGHEHREKGFSEWLQTPVARGCYQQGRRDGWAHGPVGSCQDSQEFQRADSHRSCSEAQQRRINGCHPCQLEVVEQGPTSGPCCIAKQSCESPHACNAH